ncbi:proline iminopeptidase-family hydrolase [Streptosporangium sp. NPDC051023]|uniref:proline iminopeptidase-family hydrolase n=1 Tax=Streptosporangium sp. NPDC051023 TaxID=3155410 RepID=UPI00344D34FF
MATPEPTTQGLAPFRDWRTWYRVTGDLKADKAPLVVLHGGPGAAHDYTLRMARLAEQDRAVVHYDQLGVGLSTHLPERGADFWTVELFLEELDNLLGHLGIADRYHLIGQSWGGMLAAEHAVLRPEGLRGLVIADSPASMKLWREECDRLRTELPAEVERTLREHEAAGTTGSAEYREAEKVFNARHVCMIVPNPPEVLASDAKTAEDPTVYHTMNGPTEFHVVGTLRDWSVIDRLHRVTAPTLLVSGRHDEATPRTVQPFADHIPDVRWQIFEHSSHMPHIEEEELFLQVVGSFLDSTD